MCTKYAYHHPLSFILYLVNANQYIHKKNWLHWLICNNQQEARWHVGYKAKRGERNPECIACNSTQHWCYNKMAHYCGQFVHFESQLRKTGEWKKRFNRLQMFSNGFYFATLITIDMLLTRSFWCSRSSVEQEREQERERVRSHYHHHHHRRHPVEQLVSHSYSLHSMCQLLLHDRVLSWNLPLFSLQFYCIFDLRTPLNLFTSASDSNFVSNKMTSFLNLCEFFRSRVRAHYSLYTSKLVFSLNSRSAHRLCTFAAYGPIPFALYSISVQFFSVSPPPNSFRVACIVQPQERGKTREKLALKL